MPLGRTSRQNILDYIMNGTALSGAHTAGGSYYVSLHTASPGVDGQTSNEVSTSGTAYAPITTTAADWSTATSAEPSEVSNSGALSYAQATGSGFGTVSHFGLWNHVSTRGTANFLGSEALAASQAVAAGNTLSFPTGTLKIQLA